MTDDEDLEMIGGKVWLIVAITVLTPGIFGCAYDYHQYDDCQVNCRYCPPPPLPFPHYPECVCHSHLADEYLGNQ